MAIVITVDNHGRRFNRRKFDQVFRKQVDSFVIFEIDENFYQGQYLTR